MSAASIATCTQKQQKTGGHDSNTDTRIRDDPLKYSQSGFYCMDLETADKSPAKNTHNSAGVNRQSSRRQQNYPNNDGSVPPFSSSRF